ncbi:MAG: MFS transporter [Gemmatimonadota bacterium]
MKRTQGRGRRPAGATHHAIIYSYPFAVDIALALVLFVGRHSLASRGLPEATVGSVLLVYGVGYCVSSLFMRHVVRPHRARPQMLAALGAMAAACVALARVEAVWAVQALFAILPVAVSLFINAFQAFMLGVTTDTRRALTTMAGHYTFSWSLGYALGPFASGAARGFLAWGQVYYLAAGIAAVLAVLVATLEPERTPVAAPAPGRASPDEAATGSRSLVGPAWLGVGLGWLGWNAVATWWPVQAAQLDYPDGVRGAVEFAYALAQALGALALAHAPPWHRRPLLLPVLGGVGAAGLLAFGAAASPLGFSLGAALYGLYTSSAFSLMVYHSMVEPGRAVRRVALNETIVGLSFLLGPVTAALLHRSGAPFGPAYQGLALTLVLGVTAQTAWAARLTRRG